MLLLLWLLCLLSVRVATKLSVIATTEKPCCKRTVGGTAPGQLGTAPALATYLTRAAKLAMECNTCRGLWSMAGVAAGWVGGRGGGEWYSTEGEHRRGVVRQLLHCIPPEDKSTIEGLGFSHAAVCATCKTSP